jgi:hypothetical protein
MMSNPFLRPPPELLSAVALGTSQLFRAYVFANASAASEAKAIAFALFHHKWFTADRIAGRLHIPRFGALRFRR